MIPGGSSERFGTEWIGEFSRIFAVEEPFIPSKTTSGNDESYEHLVAATRHDFVADGSESPLSFDLDPGLFMQGIVHIVLKDFPSLGADPAELKAMFAKAVDHVLC